MNQPREAEWDVSPITGPAWVRLGTYHDVDEITSSGLPAAGPRTSGSVSVTLQSRNAAWGSTSSVVT
jgi:hypothetical protein